jgi:pyruvate formate lyase activating enzyme
VKEASFYEKDKENKVRCRLCRDLCLIPDGKRGICCVRENRSGVLYTRVYGNPCSWHVDPIEKKPLFHFYPGSSAFSIATVGCNFRCLHCQNHEISQLPREGNQITGYALDPQEVVDLALRENCKSISYTYTEPTMFYEYAFDIAKMAKEKGLANNFVTNGYIEEAPLVDIRPYLDAANIDLKGFSPRFYSSVCGAKLEEVLKSIKKHKALGVWIELTTLIIPTYNDDEEELKRLAAFIAEDVGPETPWHVSAFYPTYKLTDVPRTPTETILKARDIGLKAGLRYVYTGNIPGLDGESTFCPSCRKVVIGRWGFTVKEYHIAEGSCVFCGAKIDGIGL